MFDSTFFLTNFHMKLLLCQSGLAAARWSPSPPWKLFAFPRWSWDIAFSQSGGVAVGPMATVRPQSAAGSGRGHEGNRAGARYRPRAERHGHCSRKPGRLSNTMPCKKKTLQPASKVHMVGLRVGWKCSYWLYERVIYAIDL